MILKKLHNILLPLLFLLLISPISGMAGNVMIKAKLDSATMLMGNVSPLKIEVVQDDGTKGRFPLIEMLREMPYVTLLNDTVEISMAAKPDTTSIGSGRVQIDYHLLVQVFDSGYYAIPEIPYLVDGDTVGRTNTLFLKINPVNVTAEDKISPMTGVQVPEDGSIFDAIPDWLYYWWWLILIGLGVIAATIWGVRRYRTTGTILPPKPQIPADVEALDRLRRLKERRLWEDGREKEYYTILTDILRTYLERRFDIQAMEMTTRQILDKLREDESIGGSDYAMQQVLDVADFVKFAKVRPLPDDNIKAYENAVKFVEDTAPQPDASSSSTDDEDRSESVNKKGGKS